MQMRHAEVVDGGRRSVGWRRFVVVVVASVLVLSGVVSMVVFAAPSGASTRIVLALGDGIAAGHGVGPDSNPYAHPAITNPAAYPALVAARRSDRLSGACTVAKGESLPFRADRGTPDGCTASVAHQVALAVAHRVHPDLITLAVGEDDIRFAECFRYFAGLPQAHDSTTSPCTGNTFDDNLAAFAANIHDLFHYLVERFPNTKIVVTPYYNPFPPATSTHTKACQLMRVGYLSHAPASRFPQRAVESIAFEAGARQYQTSVYNDTTKILIRLDTIITNNAKDWHKFTRIGIADLTHFAHHDICGQYPPGYVPWEFGPTLDVNANVDLPPHHHTPVTYDLDPRQACSTYCLTHDPKSTTQPKWCNTKTTVYDTTCRWTANGAPYPTNKGQTIIAGAVSNA